MKALLLAALLLWPAQAQAQGADGWSTHVALGAFMTLQGIDLAETMYLSGARQVREVNPILAPFMDRPIVFGAVKMGVATATSALLLRMHKQHPRRAFVLAALGAGVYAGVVAHNARVLRAAGR